MEQVSHDTTGHGRRRFLLGLAALAPVAVLAHPGARAALVRAAGPRLDLSSFALPALPGLMRDRRPVPGLSSGDLGRTAFIHVWASWCPTCREEHPVLMELAARGLTILGVNALDDAERARATLETRGNPYRAVGQDPKGLALRTFGLRGVPGSAVLRADRSIAALIAGPLDDVAIHNRILPLVA